MMAEQPQDIVLGDYVLYQGVPRRVIAITYAPWGLAGPRLWSKAGLTSRWGTRT